jgi:hypothetical protein
VAVLFPATDSLQVGPRGFEGRYGYIAYRAEFSAGLEAVKPVARGLLVTFRDQRLRDVTVKVAFSMHGPARARANLLAEVPGMQFDAVHERTRGEWNRYLQRCEVEGGSAQERTVFYTALYHSLLLPHVVSDADADRTVYAGFSPWDTYHTLHPLQTLICPDETGDMVASLVQTAERTGRLFTGPMAGNHAVAIILDAYHKGVRSFDPGRAYDAIRKTVSTPGRRQQDMGAYLARGYVPAHYAESVSRTLDYAYDDWVAGEFARDLGKSEESAFFLKRSFGYRYLFHAERRLMMARDTLGAWVPFGGYQEGDIWSVSWCVQHNVQDLINLMGGRRQFAAALDSVFMGGRYLHDNEPPMHYGYLFAFAGMPWRTQYHVREIMDRFYGTGPGGIPGNDDLGSLSSWYVFSAMGFYPVTPGDASYTIGTPLFEKTTIHLRNGRDLVVRADGVSGTNRYIRSATLHGAAHERPWFRHSEIAEGGQLVFTMSDRPDTTWGARPDAAPPSMTSGSPRFTVSDVQVKLTTVRPHEEVPVTVSVRNAGARGTLGLSVHVDGVLSHRHWVTLESGEQRILTLTARVHAYGRHTIGVSDAGGGVVEVVSSAQDTARLALSGLDVTPLVRRNDSLRASVWVMNTGGAPAGLPVRMLIDGHAADSTFVRLRPGETWRLFFAATAAAGWHDVTVNSMEHRRVRVYATRMEACVLDVGSEDTDGALGHDRSGFGNHGTVCGPATRGKGRCGDGLVLPGGAYLELPLSPSLTMAGEALTMMIWVRPDGRKRPEAYAKPYVDIFSQGDQHVLKMNDPWTLSFIAGGWGRGEARATVPADWNGRWHHVAGVCDGRALVLYIDGVLVQTTPVKGSLSASVFPWNIGRNAEYPIGRDFHGAVDDAKIFYEPLSSDEVRAMMECGSPGHGERILDQQPEMIS